MIIKNIKELFTQDRKYFNYSKDRIVSHNSRTLISGCALYFAVLLFYTVFTMVTNQPKELQCMYCVFDIIHIIFSIIVLLLIKRLQSDFMLTQIMCIIFELTILSFFMLEGVFTSPVQNALYLPIALLLVLLLFVHRISYSPVISFLYTFVFSIMSYIHKAPEVFKNDFYIALATFISANIGYALIAKMRHSEADALKNYEYLSETDMLTGTLNKSALDNLCNKLLSDSNKQFIFVIMDLDNFKGVNDMYGHNTGDEVLRAVGQKIKTSFSKTDSVGRFGGDEFIVIIDNNDITAASENAERVINEIADLSFSEKELKVKCSAGLAVRKAGDDYSEIFKRADAALYKAKARGKSKINIAD